MDKSTQSEETHKRDLKEKLWHTTGIHNFTHTQFVQSYFRKGFYCRTIFLQENKQMSAKKENKSIYTNAHINTYR